MRSILLSLIVTSCLPAAHAQIPNPGFEQWTNAGAYQDPVGWTTLNVSGNAFGQLFVERGTPGDQGSYYARLVARDIPGFGVTPSFLSSAGDAAGEFPWATRSAALTGRYRFMPQGDDVASLTVIMYRTDPQTGNDDVLGAAAFEFEERVAQWSSFELPLSYFGAGTPDKAAIIIVSGASGSAVAGTTLDIDALAFQGVSIGVERVSAATVTTLFPNPAADSFRWSTRGTDPVLWQVLSIEGRMLLHGHDSGARAPIQVSGLSAGSYLFLTRTADGATAVKRFVKH